MVRPNLPGFFKSTGSSYFEIYDEEQDNPSHSASSDNGLPIDDPFILSELPIEDPSIPSELPIDYPSIRSERRSIAEPVSEEGPAPPEIPDRPQTPMPLFRMMPTSPTPSPERAHSPMPQFRLMQVWTRNQPAPKEEPQPASGAGSHDGSDGSSSSTLSSDGVWDSSDSEGESADVTAGEGGASNPVRGESRETYTAEGGEDSPVRSESRQRYMAERGKDF